VASRCGLVIDKAEARLGPVVFVLHQTNLLYVRGSLDAYSGLGYTGWIETAKAGPRPSRRTGVFRWSSRSSTSYSWMGSSGSETGSDLATVLAAGIQAVLGGERWGGAK